MCAACYLCFSFFPLATLLPPSHAASRNKGGNRRPGCRDEPSRNKCSDPCPWALLPVDPSSSMARVLPLETAEMARYARGVKKKTFFINFRLPLSFLSSLPPPGNFASAAGLRDSVRYFCCVRVLVKVVRCGVAAARRHRWIALLQGVFIRPSRRHRLRSGRKMFFLLPSFLPLGRECPVAPTPFPCSVRLSFQEWPPATHRSRRASVPRHAAPCGHPECQCHARAARGPFLKRRVRSLVEFGEHNYCY